MAQMAQMSSSPSLESFDSKMRDFRLAIEYKYLIKHAPGGVYMLPELDNIRKLHGVVFVRRGLWRNGVFRFLVVLPDNYNTTGTFPHVFFTPPIYNPLVHPETGKLDITLDDTILQEWHQDKHFLHTIAMAIKKIFYVKSYAGLPIVANPEAKEALEADKTAFLSKVEACVDESLALVRRFEEGGGASSATAADGNAAAAAAAEDDDDPGLSNPKCTIVFTEPKPAHDMLLRQILDRDWELGGGDGDGDGDSDGDSHDRNNSNSHDRNNSNSHDRKENRVYFDDTEALEPMTRTTTSRN